MDYHGLSPSLMSFDYQGCSSTHGALSIPPSTCRRLQKRAPDEEPGRTPGCQRESAEQHRGCWMSGLTKWTFKEHPHFFGVYVFLSLANSWFPLSRYVKTMNTWNELVVNQFFLRHTHNMYQSKMGDQCTHKWLATLPHVAVPKTWVNKAGWFVDLLS